MFLWNQGAIYHVLDSAKIQESDTRLGIRNRYLTTEVFMSAMQGPVSAPNISSTFISAQLAEQTSS